MRVTNQPLEVVVTVYKENIIESAVAKIILSTFTAFSMPSI